MERVPFFVRETGLDPDGLEARAVLARLKVGQRVQVEIYQERPAFLGNRAAMVFDMIGSALGVRTNAVRWWIATATGHCDRFPIGNGKFMLIPHGTGPRDMNAAEFEAFWEDACDFIARVILPQINADDRTEIERLIGQASAERRPAPAPS